MGEIPREDRDGDPGRGLHTCGQKAEHWLETNLDADGMKRQHPSSDPAVVSPLLTTTRSEGYWGRSALCQQEGGVEKDSPGVYSLHPATAGRCTLDENWA